MNNKPYFLALNRIKNLGPKTILKLLKHEKSLEKLFKLSINDIQSMGVSLNIATSINTFNMSDIEIDLNWEKTQDCHILTWEDRAYPKLLKEIHDPPPVLYAQGDLDFLQQIKLAIIGTRKPSATGSETAWQLSREITSHKITIVSGLACGIDAAAHKGCLAGMGKTIAVMGTGIDRIYPHYHRLLAKKIKEQGLLLSEFPLNSLPTAKHFPQRNRIISGLCSAILVIEAAIRSGSLITASLGLEQNRDIMAVPGSIHNPASRGCNHLLKQGAKLVTSSQDILDELGVDYETNNPSIDDIFNSANNHLIDYVGFEVTTIDQIIQRSGLSLERTTCDLAKLEIQGIIKSMPGGYARCIP